MDLDAHLAGTPDSGYVSGTVTVEDAAPFAQEGGWVYQYDTPSDAINVEEYYASQDGEGYGPYGSESDTPLRTQSIRRQFRAQHEVGPNEIPNGDYVPNPNYRGP